MCPPADTLARSLFPAALGVHVDRLLGAVLAGIHEVDLSLVSYGLSLGPLVDEVLFVENQIGVLDGAVNRKGAILIHTATIDVVVVLPHVHITLHVFVL